MDILGQGTVLETKTHVNDGSDCFCFSFVNTGKCSVRLAKQPKRKENSSCLTLSLKLEPYGETTIDHQDKQMKDWLTKDMLKVKIRPLKMNQDEVNARAHNETMN